MLKWVDPTKLVTRAPFATLFAIEPHLLEAITEDMNAHGYDASKPIDVWSPGDIVLDGHTRLQASIAAELTSVPVFQHGFLDENDALQYAIKNQRNRRNLTDAELLRCVQALDERQGKGGDRRSINAPDGALNNRSSEDTANLLGISPRKVERARTVLDHADEETLAAVDAGQATINAAYNATQDRRRAEAEAAPVTRVATFNRTNDNIEWASWSWNPVTGCQHGCPYCYARDIANRFSGGFSPAFHPERLDAPQNTKVPASDSQADRAVFVCSMADLFGDWVPQEWIDQVLDAVRAAPQWTFIFLSKNPARMATIDWPDNAWVGTTVDCQVRAEPAQEAFRAVRARVRFLSCEPLNEQVTFTDLSMFDWVIIGGRSKSVGMPAFQPDFAWVENIHFKARAASAKVYWKPNLESRPREYPRV